MEERMNNAFSRVDEHGFTLFEVLLSLSLLVLLLSFYPIIFQTAKGGFFTKETTTQQVTMFFNHVAKETREASSVTAGKDYLLLNKIDQKDIEISLTSNGHVRRQSDGEGYVLLLESVKSFICANDNKVVTCSLVLEGGEQYQKTMLIPFRHEEKQE